MPLHIIKSDITRMRCDAIVNAANNTLLGGGGVDGAIHAAAGRKLLEECLTLGGCESGDAKITKAYDLPCKYVIHTVGPIWQGGAFGEKEVLESCYKKSLSIAKEYACETVAFPLISSGAYGYPRAAALSVAIKIITDFLKINEMTVYIVIYDKSTYEIDGDLLRSVNAYIDDNYREDFLCCRSVSCDRDDRLNAMHDICSEAHFSKFEHDEECYCSRPFESRAVCEERTELSLEDRIAQMDDSFAVMLLKLIDEKGINDVTCYKNANVSRQTWHKILSDKNYKPSKNTVIAFAISLELTLIETKRLLESVGFALSKSNKFDVIIEYFLSKREYDIFKINETLFEFDQPCLGV